MWLVLQMYVYDFQACVNRCLVESCSTDKSETIRLPYVNSFNWVSCQIWISNHNNVLRLWSSVFIKEKFMWFLAICLLCCQIVNVFHLEEQDFSLLVFYNNYSALWKMTFISDQRVKNLLKRSFRKSHRTENFEFWRDSSGSSAL